ncbi:DUF4180 domain-containing protein [Oscillospiraceae bacterium MB08-C2-2]|nr:DUF4180 domain-containing protein [Oscillospiraceae bacterium MB08-C2-2]
MNYTILGQAKDIVYITEAEKITDAQTALDIIMSANYDTGCRKLIFDKASFADHFFILSSGFAGEVLQKFSNYNMKVAFVGDYSGYTSKPLQDFIYESNKGNTAFFVSTLQEAAAKLDSAK